MAAQRCPPLPYACVSDQDDVLRFAARAWREPAAAPIATGLNLGYSNG